MFKVGEYVSYGSTGVCKVEGITQLEIDRSHNTRDYYILVPVYEQRHTIYCPVDSGKVNIRKNISAEESYRLMKEIPDIEVFENYDKKIFEEKCKAAVSSCDYIEWMRLIKSLMYDRNRRLKQGRKNTSSNERYMREAENKLYGELSVALQKEKEQIESMVMEILVREL